jgi:hypothetical protein
MANMDPKPVPPLIALKIVPGYHVLQVSLSTYCRYGTCGQPVRRIELKSKNHRPMALASTPQTNLVKDACLSFVYGTFCRKRGAPLSKFKSVTGATLLVALSVSCGGNSESPSSNELISFDSGFEVIVSWMEEIDPKTESYRDDTKVFEDAFWNVSTDSGSTPEDLRFSIEAIGPSWLADVQKATQDYLFESRRLVNEIRSENFGMYENSDLLDLLRTNAIAHYYAWEDFAEAYYSGLKDWIIKWSVGEGFPFNDFEESLEIQGESINQTYEDICGLLGEKQPAVQQGNDFSSRIERMCAA